MWWSRVVVTVAAAAVLGACGFRPLHGKHAGAGTPEIFATIKVDPIPDRIGQQLHNHLLTALNPRGRPGNPRFVIKTTVTESSAALAVRKTSFATRANLNVVAQYHLYDATGSGQPLLTTTSSITVSYNILDSDFATLMAEKDARARAVRELSEDIRLRLGVYFSNPENRRP